MALLILSLPGKPTLNALLHCRADLCLHRLILFYFIPFPFSLFLSLTHALGPSGQ
jgi:hypothetical protein